MTATDELRALLDEREVEWHDGGEGLTIIPANDDMSAAWEVNMWPSGKDMGDCLWVQNRHPLTPEQVVEATLGSRTCRRLPADNYDVTCIVRGRGYEMEFGYWKCSECGTNCFEGARYCMNCGAKVVGE